MTSTRHTNNNRGRNRDPPNTSPFNSPVRSPFGSPNPNRSPFRNRFTVDQVPSLPSIQDFTRRENRSPIRRTLHNPYDQRPSSTQNGPTVVDVNSNGSTLPGYDASHVGTVQMDDDDSDLSDDWEGDYDQDGPNGAEANSTADDARLETPSGRSHASGRSCGRFCPDVIPDADGNSAADDAARIGTPSDRSRGRYYAAHRPTSDLSRSRSRSD